MKNSCKIICKVNLYLSVFLGVLTVGCRPTPEKQFLGVDTLSIHRALETHLHNWYPRIVDTIHGGYWTNFEYNWVRSAKQEKMLVSQSRDLWTASRAAMEFPEESVYRRAADRGYRFLTTQMWDSIHGGFYEYYYPDSSARTDPSYKLVYGNAFALYALSEYARINPDPRVISWVKKTFTWLEQSAHDPLYGGYFNLVLPGHPVPPTDASADALIKRVNWSGADQKDQNTSIHLLEALTAADLVAHDSLIHERLGEMLGLVRDTMAAPEGYLRLFFSRSWKPVSNRDSSREYIIRHPWFDHISYGHNIETAYLLTDAAMQFSGKTDPHTAEVARKLLDHTLDHGFDRNYYGLFDKGYSFPGEQNEIILDSTKTWWAQAEAWHTLAMFSLRYPQDKRYGEAFRQMWQYIEKELTDAQYGGWYNNGLDTDPGNRKDRKAHDWKSCYHNGRALFQVMSYARSH